MRITLRNIVNKLFYNNNSKPLGRWKLEYCVDKTNRKIDMSNEDHCGPCGQYIVTKIENVNLSTNKLTNNNNES
jgi:hypothetical protein